MTGKQIFGLSFGIFCAIIAGFGIISITLHFAEMVANAQEAKPVRVEFAPELAWPEYRKSTQDQT